ncbi:FHA domain-containing protein FhaB/FipA [Microbacterium trichothecenolyticum]|uniref:PSer/pThr/pTyr-binding forkhead associated (FHA) protein n=1 Tax=Microbacterium trichothecenolyticum TaxID=69370 RepID=A0ABU0TW90_MICTR|nr:FHA domain-containing protein [Microbacterium trichothecenolyticum]MDQ1123920.1 pSer/pThr/pTyr-binding forkhead associated (FHA) protein [Microbacterium trichothecenolyticum]
MSQLTLLLLQGGFLVLLWFFVFGVVYSLRADLFGVKVRKLPEPVAAATPAAAAPTAAPDAVTTQVKRPAATPAPEPTGGLATTATVSRIVITSGPKAGLELPLGTEPLTIGRSSESGLVVRDDYTSSHHARLVLWGEQWMLQDLDSTNGTSHDGVRVASPVQVKVGAPIKVGATTFELRK